MPVWIEEHQAILWVLAVASVVVFVGSLLTMPALAVRIPADYFTHEKRPRSPWADQHPLIRWTLLIVKNVIGALFLLAGIAMLMLPGQGLLTMLIGFLMLDGPGKYRVEKWLVGRRHVLRSINWLRRRRGREPLRSPHEFTPHPTSE